MTIEQETKMSDPKCPDCGKSLLGCQGWCMAGKENKEKQVREEIAKYIFILIHSIGYPIWELEDVWKLSKENNGRDYQKYCIHADQILSKLRECGFMHLDDPVGGEVEEWCNASPFGYHAHNHPANPCKVCHGTGKLTRPRTLRDLLKEGIDERA